MTPFRLRYADRIAAVFLLGTGILLVMSIALFVKGQNLFVKRYEFWTLFEDGGGVAPETPVKIAGIEVGKVRRVSLTDDNQVKVVFEVLEDFAGRIRMDPKGVDCEADEDSEKRCGSRVTVSLPAGLGAFLPSSGLSISVGNRNNPPVPPGGFVKTKKSKGLQELLADLQKEGVVKNAQNLVEQVSVLITRINDVKGPIWQSVENVEAVTRRVRDGKGVVGEALVDNSKLHRRLDQSLTRLDNTLASLESASNHVASVTEQVEGSRDKIDRFLGAMDEVAAELKQVSLDLRAFASGAREVPKDVRQATQNLDQRIDDLGDIIRGLKTSFPLNLVVEDEQKKDVLLPAAPNAKQSAATQGEAALETESAGAKDD